jgi:nitroreductase
MSGSIGMGGVWLGEILKNKEMVNKILDAPDSYELMAVVALGHPAKKERSSDRKELSGLVFLERFGDNW